MAIEIPPPGTYGARMPGGPILRVSAGAFAGLYRLLGGRIVGGDLLILTTVGGRSGRERVAVVNVS